jgi:dienelactone hydrolase
LKESGHPYQITLYSGVSHGFAVRGDLSNKQILFAKEQAFYQAISWFDEFIKG